MASVCVVLMLILYEILYEMNFASERAGCTSLHTVSYERDASVLKQKLSCKALIM